jgi:hypothetical protein
MGLDQYLYKKVTEDFHYWRKHPAIQEWMEQEWLRKGGEGQFNCVELELDEDTLTRLIDDIENDRLNYDASGFFYGRSLKPCDDDYNEQKEEDLRIFRSALIEVKNGATIAYSSWW